MGFLYSESKWCYAPSGHKYVILQACLKFTYLRPDILGGILTH